MCGGVTTSWADGPEGGVTIGNVFLTEGDLIETLRNPNLLAHEAKHSDQWAILGPAFAPMYLGSDGALSLFGVCGPFEGLAGYEAGNYQQC